MTHLFFTQELTCRSQFFRDQGSQMLHKLQKVDCIEMKGNVICLIVFLYVFSSTFQWKALASQYGCFLNMQQD